MPQKLNKQTARDFQDAIDNISYSIIDGWVFDWDEDYLYAYSWEDTAYVRVMYRYSYTYTNGVLSVDKESKTPIVRDTNYTVVETPMEKELKGIKKLLSDIVVKGFGGSSNNHAVIKQFNEDKMEVVEPLYIAFGEVDGHGDAYKNEEAVYDLVKAVNEAREAGTLQPAFGHLHKTNTFSIGEAWVNEEESMLGDTLIPKLQPLVKIKFNKQEVYEARLRGDIAGLSIGAIGSVDMVKSLLDDLKGEAKPKRLLSKFSLAHKGGHLSYTDWSMGGAASLKNDVVQVVKGMKKELNEHQKKLLKEVFGEEFVELEKKLFSDTNNEETAPSTSDSEAAKAGVEETNVNKGKDDNMSQELLDELQSLKKELKARDIKEAVSGYELKDEVLSGLTKALVELKEDQSEAVIKAIEAVASAGKEQVSKIEKELDEAKEALTKEKDDPSEGEKTDLQKEFENEQGQDGSEVTKSNNMTLAQKVSQINKQKSGA